MAPGIRGSRSQLIPNLAGEAEYLEARRIAGELYKAHQAFGGLERVDAVKLATLCAAFEGSLDFDPPTLSENDLSEQRATLQAVAASIRKKPTGLVRIAAAHPDGTGPTADR